MFLTYLGASQDELAANVTLEQGKTLADGRGDVFRGLGTVPPHVVSAWDNVSSLSVVLVGFIYSSLDCALPPLSISLCLSPSLVFSLAFCVLLGGRGGLPLLH